MTEEELAERSPTSPWRMPHYGSQHAHLTPEEEAAFEAEGRVPVIRFRVPEDVTYEFEDLVKGPITFESLVSSWRLGNPRATACQPITLR